MPFYEYQCRACGAQTEVLQKITDAPLKKCPECGKSRLEKLVSAPVFRLKGGGWYETDFKGDKDVKRNLVDSDKGEAGADAPAAEKSAGKGEEASGSSATPAATSAPEAKAAAKAAPKPVAAAGRPAGRTPAATRAASSGKAAGGKPARSKPARSTPSRAKAKR